MEHYPSCQQVSVVNLVAFCGDVWTMQFVRFQLKCYTNKTVADFTSQALIMFLFVVKAMSMRVCDVSGHQLW